MNFKGRHGRHGKRHVPGEMNKTEEEYSEILYARQVNGEIQGYWFEPLGFRLAKKCHYHPDFAVLNADGSMEFIDCKGGGPIEDDSLVKIKTASERFWMFGFAIEQKQSKKLGGGWKRRDF